MDRLALATLGAQAVGIAACVVYPDASGTLRLFLQQRGERLATYPGSYAPVPVFGCQPTGRVSRTGASFRHNLVREFGEEPLGLAEDLQHADNHVHPDWFYAEGRMPQLLAALDEGQRSVHELGFGFDNGEVVVAVLCEFTSSAFVDQQRAHLQHNWEVRRFREVPLFSSELDEQLVALQVHPGSTFAIDLARSYLRRADPEPEA